MGTGCLEGILLLQAAFPGKRYLSTSSNLRHECWVSVLQYFNPQQPERGLLEPRGMQSDMLDPSIVSPLYILSKICPQLQLWFHGSEQSLPKELQERPVLRAKYQGLINIAYFSWCGYIAQHRCRLLGIKSGLFWFLFIWWKYKKFKQSQNTVWQHFVPVYNLSLAQSDSLKD